MQDGVAKHKGWPTNHKLRKQQQMVLSSPKRVSKINSKQC